MSNGILISWSERFMKFSHECLKNFKLVSPDEALNKCVKLSGELANSKLTVLLSSIDTTTHRVIVSSDTTLKEQYIDYKINPEEEPKITICKNTFIVGKNLPKSDNVLIIPIHEANFNGILLYFFDQSPNDLNGLIEYADLVKRVCEERIKLKLLYDNLEDSRLRFNTSSESISDGIIFLEEKGEYGWVNYAAANLISIPEECPSLKTIVECLLNFFKRAENYSELEGQLHHFLSNSTDTTKEWSGSLIFTSNKLLNVSCTSITFGKDRGRIITFKDATYKLESNFVKSQIHDLSKLLSSVLNSSLSGILAFKSLRNKRGKIIDFECLITNERAKKILGKKEYEIVGQKLFHILPENFIEGLFDKFNHVVETGDPFFLEHYFENEEKKKIGLRLLL